MKIKEIRIDGGTQPRAEINNEVLAEYAEIIRAGDDFPPVTVFHDGSSYWLADGFHRYHAYRMAGAEEIPAEVKEGTLREAMLYSLGANHTHGIRRTNADKRKAVETMLKDEEWKTWSDREIASRCNVTHTFVATLRKTHQNSAIDFKGKNSNDGNVSIILDKKEGKEERKYTTKTGRTGTRKVAKPSVNEAAIQAIKKNKKEPIKVEPSNEPDGQAEEETGPTIAKWRYDRLKEDYQAEKQRAKIWETEAENAKAEISELIAKIEYLEANLAESNEMMADYMEMKRIVEANDGGESAKVIKELKDEIWRANQEKNRLQENQNALVREIKWARREIAKITKEKKKAGQEPPVYDGEVLNV